MATKQFHNWLRKFKSTGDICPLRLGMTREDLRLSLGEPDLMGGLMGKHQVPCIWKYKEMEFHFGPQKTDGLHLIYEEDEKGISIVVIKRFD